MDNIVDYFYVCGLDMNTGLECLNDATKQADVSNQISLELPYKCHILQHFPEHVLNCKFDDESTALVTMPSGLWFFTQRSPLFHQGGSAPRQHSFIITREDGTRMHGFALLFPEEVTHPDIRRAIASSSQCRVTSVSSSMDELRQYSSDHLSFDEEKDKLFCMKAIGLLSRFPFFHGLFGWLEDIWATLYIHPSNTSDSDVPLRHLETCIHNLLFHTTLPPPGRFVTFQSPFRNHYGYYPGNTPPCAPSLLDIRTRFMSSPASLKGEGGSIELPLFEYSMHELCILLGLDNLLRLFTCILLEYRIILLSQIYHRLMLVAEGMTCLLAPFTWSHVYAPILPISLAHFVDAPVPYIMGIKQYGGSVIVQDEPVPHIPDDATRDKQQQQQPMQHQVYHSHDCHTGCISPIELASEANVCYVYVDDGHVVVPDELPQFPNLSFLKQALQQLLFETESQKLTGYSSPSNKIHDSPALPPARSSKLPQAAPVLRPRPPSELSLSRWDSRKHPGISNLKHGCEDIHQPPLVDNSSPFPSHSRPKFITGNDSQDQLDELDCVNELDKCGFTACTRIARAIVTHDTEDNYTELLHFNYRMRSIFLDNFVEMFKSYENFLVHDRDDKVNGGVKRMQCGLHAFDKIGFLSDQPETHLPFLSAFFETQMFINFLDYRLNNSAPYFSCVERRLPVQPLRIPAFAGLLSAHVATHTNRLISTDQPEYNGCVIRCAERSHNLVSNNGSRTSTGSPTPLPDLLTGVTKLTRVIRDEIVTEASLLISNQAQLSSVPTGSRPSHFPILQADLIKRNKKCYVNGTNVRSVNRTTLSNIDPKNSSSVSNTSAPQPSRLHYRLGCANSSAPVSPPILNPLGLLSDMDETLRTPNGCMSTPIKRAIKTPTELDSTTNNAGTGTPIRNSSIVHSSHQFAQIQRSGMAQAHWDFVDALLDECKHRTKRMVLKKMGQEAVELGHIDPAVSVIEENTLVSGLCDLLERIWSHGLNHKQGKSALWSHLVCYLKRHHPHRDFKLSFGDHDSKIGPSPPCSVASSSSSHDSSSPNSVIESFNNKSLSSNDRTSSPKRLRRRLDNHEKHDRDTTCRDTRRSSTLPPSVPDGPSSTATPHLASVQSPSPVHKLNRTLNTRSKSIVAHRDGTSTPARKSCDRPTLTNTTNLPINTSWRSRLNLFGQLSAPQPDSLLANFATPRPLQSERKMSGKYIIPSTDRTGVSYDSTGTGIDLSVIFGDHVIKPSLLNDIVAVQSIEGVKTDIGFARAFIRLSLEKKLLSEHLATLLADVKLLRQLYSRYAFLRCEEEREQFLVHLLSLNAVDYYSFTRMLTKSELTYQIFVCTGRKPNFFPTSRAWIRLHGHLGSTQHPVWIPRGQNVFQMKHSNLGLLSTMQIGHDNAGPTPRWFIEFVLIYSLITGQLYYFPCCRWFGRGIEDDALERVLIGESIRLNKEDPRLHFNTALRHGLPEAMLNNVFASPSLVRRGADKSHLSPMVIQEQLADAVNRLLKYFCKSGGRTNSGNIITLWCGDRGLVPSLQLVFNFAFRSNRFFQRRIYVWDYIEKVASSFSGELNLSNPVQPLPTPTSLHVRSGSISSPFSTHSLPRFHSAGVNRTISSNVPTHILHPSPSLCTVPDSGSDMRRDTSSPVLSSSAGLYAFSQPNSPALPRILSTIASKDSATQTSLMGGTSKSSSLPIRQVVAGFVQSVLYVTQTSSNLGKEGKLQRLICRAIHDRILADWFSILPLSPVTSQMYETRSFFFNRDLRQTLQDLLSALNEFEFPIDEALLGSH